MPELVIDADAHVAEDVDDLRLRFDDDRGGLAPMRVAGLDGTALQLEGRLVRSRFAPPAPDGALPAGAFDPFARVAHLDREGIDAAVLFPTIGLLAPLYRDARAAAAFTRAVNDWLIDFCAAAPSRLCPVAVLPQQDPRRAAAELERALDAGAIAGILRPNPVAGRTPADASFDVLWSCAAALDAAVVLHEGTFDAGIPTLGSQRAESYAELHLMAHPFELQATLATMALRGVFERHPRLRLGCFEAGFGWAPYLSHRLSAHARAYQGGSRHPPIESQVWVTAEPDEPLLRRVDDIGWSSRVCFATDYPHRDAAPPGVVAAVRSDLSDGPNTVDRYLGTNAIGLFGDRLSGRLTR